MIRKFFIFFITLITSAALSGQVLSQEAGPVPVYQSEYISVYGYQGMDTGAFLDKIHYTSFLHSEIIFNKGDNSASDMLSRTLEEIYLEVLDLLDIHDYQDRISIYILSGADELKAAAGENSKEYSGSPVFHSGNAVYLISEGLTLSLLTDELSQTLIETYFPVPPPATVRQALCGYVQYHVNQLTDKALP